MKQNLHNIFNSGACPSSDDLQQYIGGNLSPEDANAMEQHIESCEMCSEALEGLQAFSAEGDIDKVTADLNRKVDELVETKEKNKIIAPWYKIAAVIALLVMVGGLLFINNQFETSNEQIFSEHYEPFEKKEKEIKFIPPGEPDVEVAEEALVIEEDVAEVASPSIDNREDLSVVENEVIEEQPVQEAVGISGNNKIQILDDDAAPIADKDIDLAATTDKELQGDEVNVRSGRENSMDYYVDGIKTSDNEIVESVVIERDASSQKQVLEQINSSKDKRLKKSESVKMNKNVPRAYQDAVSMKAGITVNTGANQELINFNYNKGESEYNSKNYAQAGLWFKKALELDAGHYQSNFYAGLSALQLEQTNECINYLNKVIDKEKENEVLYEPGLWYISLAYIKIEDNRKAKKYLKKIVSLNGEYKTKAEELLGEL